MTNEEIIKTACENKGSLFCPVLRMQDVECT